MPGAEHPFSAPTSHVVVGSLLVLAIGVYGASLLLACSSSTTPSPDATDGGSSEASGSSSGGVKDGGANAATCAKEATSDGCKTCCGIDESILSALDQAFVECACIDTCKTPCAASACAATPSPPDPADECDLCINGKAAFTACNVKSEADCKKNNAACNAALTCGDDAKCLEKDGG